MVSSTTPTMMSRPRLDSWITCTLLTARATNGMIATTFGAAGAVLSKNGEDIARAKPPRIDAVDTTAAGDTFTAALTVALVEGQGPEEALQFACAAGAAAATKLGAQPSLPTRDEVTRLMS